MMSENPLRQGMRTPIMSLGVIPGKVHLDWGHVQQCMANADDPNTARRCYPSGGKDYVHDVMPGDFSIGEKCVRDFSNGFNELGFVAVNGIYVDNYKTHREMQSNFYPQGVAVTECRVSDPMGNSSTQDPDHGYAIVKAGTVPTINNGPFTLYPNTFVALRFPPSGLYSGQKQVEGDISFGDGNHRARTGTFPGQLRPELVPFDYTDFAIHYDSAYHLMGQTQNNGGISDITFDDVLRKRRAYVEDNSQFSAEQEECLGHYYGTVNLVKAALQVLQAEGHITLTNNPLPNAFDGVKGVYRDIFLNAYGYSVSAPTQKADLEARLTAKGVGNVPDDDKNPDTRLRKLGAIFHSGHVMGNWYDKTSWIVGKPLNACSPSETLDLLLGHFTL